MKRTECIKFFFFLVDKLQTIEMYDIDVFFQRIVKTLFGMAWQLLIGCSLYKYGIIVADGTVATEKDITHFMALFDHVLM